jgi:beta-glucosidase
MLSGTSFYSVFYGFIKSKSKKLWSENRNAHSMMQRMTFIYKLFITFSFALVILTNDVFSQPYLDPDKSVDDRVNDLLSRMTLDEKIGQMVQAERSFADVDAVIRDYFLGSVLSGGGSIPGNKAQDWIDMYNEMQQAALSTRLKIPIIYGIDAVHGNNNVYGATIFPHNIGLGCTRDTLLVKKCAEATAIEVIATGLNWTFSPCIAVPRDIRWGRSYEGFGETPELQEMMAQASVKGYQGDSLGSPFRILACAKHFIADGGTIDGHNAGNAVMTEDELRKIHLPGYIKAIKAGVGSIMVSYSKWNGVLCHANSYLITDLLKGELGFSGFVVTDWNGIEYISNDLKTCIKTAVNAGIDMYMEPYNPINFIANLKQLVSEGGVPQSRIDDAVSRILRVKFRLGLFEQPYATNAFIDSLGNTYHRSIARVAVRESQVLLKNQGVLPLSKINGKILVAGSKAADLGSQCGGWTISWQGSTGNITIGTNILDAVKSVRGAANVIYSANGATAEKADVAVVVVGETPYAEGNGDNQDPGLNTSDLNTLSNVKNLGIPYAVLLLSGRPLILGNVITDADACVACWLPGTEGLGITDVLFGDYDFTGKLSQSWPISISQEPVNWGDSPYSPLFPYGYGLSTGQNAISYFSNSSVSIYPNPANDFITVRSDYFGSIEIFNALGKLELITTLKDYQQNINISNLKTGIYLLKITSGSGQILISKFIKN